MVHQSACQSHTPYHHSFPWHGTSVPTSREQFKVTRSQNWRCRPSSQSPHPRPRTFPLCAGGHGPMKQENYVIGKKQRCNSEATKPVWAIQAADSQLPCFKNGTTGRELLSLISMWRWNRGLNLKIHRASGWISDTRRTWSTTKFNYKRITKQIL